MKRSKLLPLLLEAATVGLQTKARVVRRSLRRNTARKIFANQEQEIEAALTKAIAPLIEEQVASMKDELLAMGDIKATTTSDQAQALASQVFDPNDQKWKDGLVDRALPAMVVPMLKAMKAAMVEAGVNPVKGLKQGNPFHDPRSGRFTSGGRGGEGGVKDRQNRLQARERGEEKSKELHAKLKSNSKLLNKKEKLGEDLYIGSSYTEINELLRSGKSLKTLRYHEEINAFGSRTKAKIEETITYRGLRGSRIEGMLKDAGEGGIVKAKGFVSTSLDIRTATAWAKRSDLKTKLAVMEIKAKTGRASGLPGQKEYEITQAPGTNYRYVGKETQKIQVLGQKRQDIDIYMFEEI